MDVEHDFFIITFRYHVLISTDLLTASLFVDIKQCVHDLAYNDSTR